MSDNYNPDTPVAAESTAAKSTIELDSQSSFQSLTTNSETESQSITKVDGLGLSCPEPLMLLRKCVKDSPDGQLIALYSDDPVSLRDVPAFCDFMHHKLISLPDDKHPHRFLIRKGG